VTLSLEIVEVRIRMVVFVVTRVVLTMAMVVVERGGDDGNGRGDV